MRSGIIAKKVGMTRLFMEDGKQIPVTVLQLDGLQVVAQRTAGQGRLHRRSAGRRCRPRPNVPRKLMRGHFAAAKVEPKRKLAEFRVSEDGLIDVGAEISAEHFLEGQKVDVSAAPRSVRAFAGAMKRHNFGGLRASHGVSISAPFAWFDRSVSGTWQASSRARKWPVTWVLPVLPPRTWRL